MKIYIVQDVIQQNPECVWPRSPWHQFRQYRDSFRKSHSEVNKCYGEDDSTPREYFRITRWGKIATPEEIQKLL